MTRFLAIATAAGALLAGPALAQGFDPTAQRLEMEQLRARTELNAASAAAFRAQGAMASQQLQAATRNDGGVGAAVAADAEARAEARRQEELRRRAAEDVALELERRRRAAGARPPR